VSLFNINSVSFIIYLKNCGQKSIQVKMFDVTGSNLKETKNNFCLQPGFSMEMYNASISHYNVTRGGIDCTVEIELPNVGMKNRPDFQK
jgi:hypothetical protein